MCITFYDHILLYYFTNNLSFGFISLLCYIVCVNAPMRPKILYKFLPLVVYTISNHWELSIVDKHIIHYPWQFQLHLFKISLFFFLIKKEFSFQNMKETIDLQKEFDTNPENIETVAQH